MPAVRRPRTLSWRCCRSWWPVSPPATAAGRREGPRGRPSPSASSTPLTALDTAGMAVPRAAFCERVAPADAQRALGGEVASSTSYGNGDRAQLTARVRDVAHEFGCTWTARGRDPRAGVGLHSPGDPGAGPRSCGARPRSGGAAAVLPWAPAFGSPSVAVRCREPGPRVRTTFSGLFGDAWLSCELDVAGRRVAGLADRTGQWCVTVARAASAPCRQPRGSPPTRRLFTAYDADPSLVHGGRDVTLRRQQATGRPALASTSDGSAAGRSVLVGLVGAPAPADAGLEEAVEVAVEDGAAGCRPRSRCAGP